MHGTTQSTFFDSEHSVKSTRRNIVYVPPTVQDIDRYAHEVCRELAQRTNSPLPNTEITRGFAAFIRAAVNITLHNLSENSKATTSE